MTETSYQYGAKPPLPVASPPTYLLLIDSRVSNYQDIINAKQPGVYHIVFDAPSRPTHSKFLIKNIEDKIAELGVAAFTSIGLVQHNDEKPVYEMFGRTSDIIKPRIRAVETVDPDFQSWNSVTLFIMMLRNNYGIEYFDMMACALYSNPDWKYIIDKLTVLTGVTVRASTDDTGAASLGGDWFLESHTGVNLKSFYFTESIENYNGLLYTASTTPSTTPTKKLILIDHRIKDIDVIINAMNDDTYCLVFNYFYDTPVSILSKLRFLNSDNRYILDHFHYETPEIPTQIDASGNHCAPCDEFDIADIQLLPGILQNEYLEYMTSAAAAADPSGNGGLWPFHGESTNITINKPVFFQRAKLVEPAAEYNSANYKQRPMVLVSDLDQFYELGQDAGEIVGNAVAFECVGIIQHTVDPYIGYKFIGGGDDSVSPAIVQDIASRDAGLSSWASFAAFIQSLKTVHQMTTLDMMACALYANPDWKYVIDTLAVRENITIRASLDNTGSALDEGNWVLETDNVSLTTVYFTDKIYAWRYVLATYIDTRFNALRWNDSMYASRAYDSRLKIAAGTNNFTIEAWYYETTAQINCTIVDMGYYNYLFQIRTVFSPPNGPSYGGLNLYNNVFGWKHAPSATITSGQWNHVAITRSGSTFTFYVNGIARQTFTSSASLFSDDSTFAIGLQNPGPGGDGNRMKLDTVLYDIRLWSVARTANEIRTFRNRVVPANSTGLVANYLCTDNGSSLNDRTSNALHTTIQSYDASRWSNSTVPIPNIGFLINNSYSLRTSNSGSALNALTHFDNITHTDFSGVDLSGVNFRGVDLTGCNFTNANLTNTDFTNATVLNITTTNATTTGSNLSQAITNMSAGTVLNFDGVNDYVSIGNPSWCNETQFRQTMTVECWFKTTTTNPQPRTYPSLVTRNYGGGVSASSQFSLFMSGTFVSADNGYVGFGVTSGSSNTSLYVNSSPTKYNDGNWHHIAATYTSSTGTILLYVDGSLVKSGSNSNIGLTSISHSPTIPIFIGSDAGQTIISATDRNFEGSISDVRIWNVVRSASEIADNYRMRLIGNETGLVGYWKLNQGLGSGWGSYSAVLDSTVNRTVGTLTNAGATPSGSWVVSNLKFQPRVGTMTLGPNNGVYTITTLADSSFSFVDPSSNSLGDFTYTVSPNTVANVTNGDATTKTIYSLSGANLVPTYTLYEFPEIASLSSWQIDISFTVTSNTSVGGSSWRALIGDMYNNVNTTRGWGLWVSASNRIHWSWVGATAEPGTISVSLNTPYVLTAAQSSGTITLTLRTVSTGATQTGSFSVGANVLGKGPVVIGNWINTGAEYFPGTISYVNVSVPTNQRVVTLSSGTAAGTPATVTATQDSSLDFGAGSKTASLTVSKSNPTIGTFSVPSNLKYLDPSFSFTAPTSNNSELFSFSSSNLNVVRPISPFTTTNLLARYDTCQSLNYTLGGNSVLQWNDLTGNGYHLIPNGTGPTLTTINSLTAFNFNSGRGLIKTSMPLSSAITVFMVIKYSTNIATWGSFMHHGSRDSDWAIERNSWTNALTSHNVQFQSNNVNGPPELSASNNVNYILIGRITGSTRDFWRYSDTQAAGFATGSGVSIATGNKTLYVGNSEINESCNSSIGEILYYNASLSNADVSANLLYLQNKWFNNTNTQFFEIVNAGTTTITASQGSSTLYNSGSATASLVISAVAPTIGTLTAPAKNFGDASFNLTAPTSNSGGAFTYTSSNTAVATVTSGGTVTIVGGGSTTITATQAASADGNYNSGSVSASLVVSPINPTIGTLTAPAKNFGDAQFNLTAPTSNSGGAFTYTSSNTAVATVTSGGTVTIVGGGSTTITATQAATANYNSGSVTASLVVSPIAPTIGTLTAPAKNFGDASFNLTAPTSNSDGAFTYTSSNTAVATVTTGGTVTVVGVGSTTITATQAATANYNSGSVTASLVVSPINPTIGTLTAPAKNFGDASFNLTAPTSNSGGAFTYTSSNSAVATVTSGGTVTVVGAGTTTITATQAATTNYNSGSVTASLVVSPINPTIGTLTAPAKNFGDASFNLTAPTSNSGGAFTYTSSNTAVATVTTGGTVTVVGAGTTTITATQAASADGNYNSGSVTASLVVSPINPTIGSLTAPAKNFGDASFNLTAPTSNSGGAFTYTSSNTAVATVTTGGTVTIVGAGSTTITATQAATTNYNSGSVTASLVVSPINPTIGSLSVPAKNFGDASFNLTAPTSNSGGAFTYTSSNTAVATVTTGGTVTVVGAGTTTITATQAATTNYNSGSVTASLVVSPINPTIGSLTAPAKNFGDASFNLTAPTSNSGGAFTYTSSNSAVATVTTGGTVTVVGAGTTTITATQAATTNYNSGSVTASLVVSPIAPTIGSLSVPAKNFGDASFNLTAPTSNSGGAFTYTSSNSAVATVTTGGTVTVVGAGTTTITATQAASADGNYNSGSVTASLVVSPIAPTIGSLSVPAKNFGDASFNLTAPTSNSGGAFTYTSSNTAVATVTTGGTVTVVGAGSTTITATQAATTNYNSGSVTASLVVSPIAPTIGSLSVPAKNFGDASFNLTAPTSNSGGAFTYTSSNSAVATVTTGGTVTVVGAGSTTITATQAASADGNYNSGSVTASLVVSPIAPTIGSLSVPAKNFGDASFNLTAPTSNSGGAFTYTSSNTGVATVTSGGIVIIVGAGTTTITASQEASADGNYNSGSVTASLVVSPIAPTIGSLSVPAKNFGDASFNLTAPSSNSGGAFTYTSSNTAVATVALVGGVGVVTIVGAGSTTITATQAASADGNYTGGSTVSASLVVSPIAPTITTFSIPSKNFRDASFNLTAPSSNSSGTFTYDSSNTAVATVTSGGVVTIVGAGTTTITATQAASADGNYTGGSTVSASLIVSAVAPNIGALSIPAKNFGDASFNLTAPTSDSNGAFSYTSSNAAVATVTSGGVVTIVGAGTTTITATQAESADGNYTGGSTVSASLVVSPIAPTYQSITQITKTYSTDVSFSLLAVMSGVSNSDGSYSFSTASNAISIVNGIATILAYTPSAITITASQDASGNYTASTKTFTLLVSRKTPSYGEFSIPSKTFGDASFSIVPYAPTTDSTEVPFTYTSSDLNVATINSSGTDVTIIGQGYTTITASQEASGNYAANSITTSFLVNRAAPTFLKAFTIPNKTFGDASFSLLPFTDGLDNTDGTYHFTSSNSELVSISGVDGVTATIHAYTPTPITIYVAIDACGNYAASSTSGTLTVLRAAPTIGALSVPATKNFGDASFNITAPSSNSAGAFTYTSSNTAVATVSDVGGVTKVTVVGAGSTTITATQATDGNYTSGSVSASLAVSAIAPTIGALSVPAKNFGDASFNLTAPSSNSDGAFTYTSSNTSVATVTSGGTVTVVGAGSTTITASQAASSDGNYTGGSSVSASLVVSAIAPTIGSLSVPAKNFGDASFNLTAPSSNSGGAFTYTSSDTSVATVSNSGGVGTVTVVGAGTTTITATQAASADGNYTGGSSVTASLVVSAIAPTIGALSVPAKNFGDASFNITAPSSNSSGAFTYTSSDTSVATVSNSGGVGTVTVVGAGSTTITATQAASSDGNYTGGSSVTASLVVSPIAPTIGSLSVPAKNFGDASFNLTAPTSNSGGAFTYTSSNPSVASVTTDGIVTIVAVGTTTITATQAAIVNGNYLTGSVTASLVVSPIAPTIGALSVPTKNFGDASFNLTAPSSNSGGAFTYTSSDTSVATVTSGGTVTVVRAGSTTITATQAASSDGNYTGGSSVTASLVVSAIAPTIGTLSVPAKNFGDASFNLTAPTSNSGGAFTYTSSNTSVATVSLVGGVGVVTVVGAGSTTITATQAASSDGNYTGGSSVTASLVVSAIAPTIGALSVPAKNFGDASFNLTAPTSNSGGAFTYTSSNTSVATVSLVGGVGVVTVVGAGSTTITATQAASADGNYTGGSSVSASLVVSPIASTIGALSVPAKNFGDASFNLTAPTSNNIGAFTYTSSNPSVATVTTDGIVTIVAAGTTTITATQAATTNYNSGSVTASLVVSAIAPTIGSLSVSAKNFGDASFNLTAPSSNSGGAFTYTSSNTAVATVTSGGTVTVVGAGTTTITATQAASSDGNYTGGSSVTASLVVSAIAPTIGSLSVPAKNFGDASFNLTAPSSNSGGAFTYTSSNTSVATVSLVGVVTVVGAGSTTITATQAASSDGNYNSGSVSASLVVSAIAPTIGALSVPAKNFGDASFNLTAPTSNSGGAFTYTSSNTSVATVSLVGGVGVVTVVGAGSTTITATQAASADGNYTGGSSVSASLVVSPIASTIGALSLPAKNFGDASFNLTAPTSNNIGAFTYTSSNPSVATVTTDGIVTIVAAGTTTITATQAATTNYNSGSVSASLVVSAIAPTIGTLSVSAKNFGDASFNLTAPSSSSGGAFTYTSSNTAVATVTSGGTVTVVGAGTTTITATQAASSDGNYNSGSVSASLVVSAIAPTIGSLSVPAKNFGDASFNLTAPSSNSGGAFTYTSSNTSVATVSLVGGVGVVTVVGAGSTTITATQTASADGNYTGGSSVSASLVVSAIAPTIGTLLIPAKNFGDASFNLTAPTSNSDGAFTYTSSNTSVATVSNSGGVGTVTVVGAGTTTITATQAATTNYNISGVTASLVVSAIAPTIGSLSVPSKNFGDSVFNLTAPTSNSGGAFTYTSSNTAVATVSLVGGVGTVTIVSAGTTTITATQAATTNYNSGSVSASLVVSPIAPTIGTLALSGKNVNDPSFNLTAPTSNSGGAFTYTSSNTAVATVSNAGGVGTVTIVGVGSTTITATQAASADGNYTGGSSVAATLTVTAELSNFTVPSDKKYGDASFNLTDPTSIYSGEPFTYTSSNPTVASIGGADGRTVTIHLAGSTIITATQAATGAHGELSISATLIISKKTPVITVAVNSIAKNYGDASFNIALPSSTNTEAGGGGGGGGGGAFSYSSRNTSIVSIIDSSYVSITGVGSTIIDVTQSATANFTEAVSTISITVSKGTPILSAFTVSANRTYGSAPFSAIAYPSSASAGAFTYSSSDTSVATINSSTGIITLLAAGYVNFTATQAATALYNSNTKTSNTMTVHRQILPLVRSSPTSEVINKTYGDSYFNVVATNASNGGTITYETDNPSVAGIVGLATAGIISVVTVGTATITARRGDTAQYSSHPVSWTVEVGRTTTTLTGLSDLSYNVTAAPFTVSASSASDGAVTYSLQDPSSGVLTIHPTTGLVTLRSPGSAVIVASQAQGTLYLPPASITATITVSSAGNALQGATITNTSSYESVNLSGSSLAGVTITNTTFASSNLNGSNMTNAVITNANFGNADLSGVTLTGAIITGSTFSSVTLNNADLSGAVVTNTVFTGADLSGSRLTRIDASGASFANATLSNVDLAGANITNTNFTNTNIKGANIADISFSDVQKLQLLKNSENREIPQVILTEVPGTTVLAVVSESSPLRSIPNLNLASSTLKVIIPQTSPSPVTVIQNIEIDVSSGSTRFYLPINESDYFQIQDIKYYASGGVVRNYATNAVVEVIYYNGTPIWLFAGSIVGLILQANTLNSASFVVPRIVTLGTIAPFMPTTMPTSNSAAPIVYSSSNPAIASIDASSGLITVAGNLTGEVRFTATQAQNVTHEPGVCVSNYMMVTNVLNFSLIGLNQAFNLSTLAQLDASSVNMDATDATAIFYVRLSDILNVFKYQSDAFDVNNLSAQDIKYYVFHRNWPSELRINPSHAMMDQVDSVNMLGSGFSADKSLTKHDFIRHIAKSLFNTIHGVDLFSNEEDLKENAVYMGETVRNTIDGILSDISTTSGSEAMAYDASGNKYLTNDASGNTNLCRELMRQVAANSPLRFYNNGGDNAGIKTVPFYENDTIQFKLVMQAAIQQNLLTGVSEIPTRSYTIKLVLKNTVNAFANTNTTVSDSEMYPNSFPYSTSVTTFAPTADSSGVYNIYSPPAPIPFARFGYNGWYYTNSTAWVNVEPAVRNHVKWLVEANTASSKVGDLQYVRFNLKIHNKTALPYLMIYTDAGSTRKYPVVGGSASLTNGGLYSFFMNFNSYGREPAVIGHTNAPLAYTIGSGTFADNEGIVNIALETDSNATTGSVEFTLMSIVVGELSTSTGATTEKEYGFQASVSDSYP